MNGDLVDRDDGIVGFVVTARIIPVGSVGIGSDSGVVYGVAELEVNVSTNNPITTYSHLVMYVPL